MNKVDRYIFFIIYKQLECETCKTTYCQRNRGGMLNRAKDYYKNKK